MASVVHIFCSDTARTGKTLLARVFADLSSLRREGNPIIFDTDISGNGIVNYFPEKTSLIDLSMVADQVRMFDTIMQLHDPNGPSVNKGSGAGKKSNQSGVINSAAGSDFVVDVAASDLGRFFEMFNDIGFERGAAEARLDVRIYYLVNWSLKSLQRTEQIRSLLKSSDFFAVRNMGIQAFSFTPAPHEADLVPEIDISLFLKALSPSVFGLVNEKEFSFARFASGEYTEIKTRANREIWNFLEGIYNQTSLPARGSVIS